MTRHSHVQGTDGSAGINLTPLIDMVFILLIFFLVSASFVKEAGVEVDRPQARTATRQEQAGILIAVTGEGAVWIDQRRHDPRAVRAQVERLHAANPEAGVVIVADREARTGVVIQVLDQVRLAGVSNVSIAAAEGER
jgi:biopolymer transport protein ExbD